jgi:hypothetical protein
MQKSATSALLSAFVFPGIGHLYLRSYARGLILLAICTAALIDFIQRAWREAELISAQVNAEISETGAIDLESLVAHATAAVDHIDNKPFTVSGCVLIACWLFSIFDSYRIGKNVPSPPPPLQQGEGRKPE